MHKDVERLLPVLREIELAIKLYYHEHPDLTDQEVLMGIDELVKRYTALYRGRMYRQKELGGHPLAIMKMEETLIEDKRDFENLSLKDALTALKEIRASVKRHQEKRNPQAYLEFIEVYVV